MKRYIVHLAVLVFLTSCSEIPNPISELRKEDIIKYGISSESDKLMELGIQAISVDKDGKIHFWVRDVNPKTKKDIEKGLVKIFGRKFEFVLHDSKDLYVEPKYPE